VEQDALYRTHVNGTCQKQEDAESRSPQQVTLRDRVSRSRSHILRMRHIHPCRLPVLCLPAP
jgi:hypothetical protein